MKSLQAFAVLLLLLLLCPSALVSCNSLKPGVIETYAPVIRSGTSLITVTLLNKVADDPEAVKERAALALKASAVLTKIAAVEVPTPEKLKEAILSVNPGSDAWWTDYATGLTGLYEGFYMKYAGTDQIAALKTAIQNVVKGIQDAVPPQTLVTE